MSVSEGARRVRRLLQKQFEIRLQTPAASQSRGRVHALFPCPFGQNFVRPQGTEDNGSGPTRFLGQEPLLRARAEELKPTEELGAQTAPGAPVPATSRGTPNHNQ